MRGSKVRKTKRKTRVRKTRVRKTRVRKTRVRKTRVRKTRVRKTRRNNGGGMFQIFNAWTEANQTKWRAKYPEEWCRYIKEYPKEEEKWRAKYPEESKMCEIKKKPTKIFSNEKEEQELKEKFEMWAAIDYTKDVGDDYIYMQELLKQRQILAADYGIDLNKMIEEYKKKNSVKNEVYPSLLSNTDRI